MSQKNIMFIAIGMVFIVGACTQVADEPTKISDLPETQKIGAGMFGLNIEGAAANSLMWQQKDVVYEVYTANP